jgi:hypothetical protein
VANGQQSEFNGCGPQGGLDLPIFGKGDWIPDSPLDLADFFSACQGHDCCYGTCGKSKSVCDENFLNDMIAACNRSWPVSSVSKGIINGQYYAMCLAVARVYYDAVSATGTGQDAYNAGQKEVCNCCVDCQTYAQTLGALNARWWRWCPDPDSADGHSCMSVCSDMSNCGGCGSVCPDEQCDANGCQTGACQDGQCVYYPGNLDYCSDCQGMEYCYSK